MSSNSNDSDRQDGQGPWHLDKRVPVVLILAIIGQTFLGGWYVSSIDSRISRLEIEAVKNQSTGERLARIEEKLTAIIDRLDRSERRP
jgi:hypothetical protein